MDTFTTGAITAAVVVILLALGQLIRLATSIKADTVRIRETTNSLKWEAIRRANHETDN